MGESKLLGVSFDARERLWAPLLPDSHLSCAFASPASAHSTCVVRVCATSQLCRSLFPNEGVSSCTSRMASSTWNLLAGRRRQDWWRHRLEQMWCQATSCHAGHRVGIWVQSYIWRLSWIKKSCRVWWHWRGMESLEEGNTSKYPQKKPHFIPYSCSLEKASMLHCDPGSLIPFRQLLPDGSFLGDPSWHGSYWCDRKRSSLILEEFLQQLRNKQD